MGNNCLRCVKWDGGKGLEVIYQAGIKRAMEYAEGIFQNKKDMIDMRYACFILDILRNVDEALSGFQGELGLIEDLEEAESPETTTQAAERLISGTF